MSTGVPLEIRSVAYDNVAVKSTKSNFSSTHAGQHVSVRVSIRELLAPISSYDRGQVSRGRILECHTKIGARVLKSRYCSESEQETTECTNEGLSKARARKRSWALARDGPDADAGARWARPMTDGRSMAIYYTLLRSSIYAAINNKGITSHMGPELKLPRRAVGPRRKRVQARNSYGYARPG